MKTEEILKTAIESYNSQVANGFELKLKENEIDLVAKLMNSFAQQEAEKEAVAFTEWLFDNAIPSCENNIRGKLHLLHDKENKMTWNSRFKTTAELYNLYKKRK